MKEVRAVDATLPYISYKVPKLHVNSLTLSSIAVRSLFPTLARELSHPREARGGNGKGSLWKARSEFSSKVATWDFGGAVGLRPLSHSHYYLVSLPAREKALLSKGICKSRRVISTYVGGPHRSYKAE